MFLTVTFYAFVVLTAVQIIYYLFYSSSLVSSKTKHEDSQLPISVIIFAKNSGKHLHDNLSYILNQEYPKFEIVLINNASNDDTLEILESFKAKHENITIIDVENTEAFWGSKKYALTLGIKAAKHNHLLFTNSSSRPISKFWLSEMSKIFGTKKTIVLGYTKYQRKATITNFLARFNNVINALQSFSAVKLSKPFMTFSENFGYTKDIFFNVKGFINHIKKQHGVHDLFLKDAASKKNTTFSLSSKSFVIKENITSFKDWYQELLLKKTIQQSYSLKHQFVVSFFTISKLLFYILGGILFFFYPWKIILPIVLSYFLINYIIVGIASKKLHEPYLIFLLPILEISLLLIQISIFIVHLISKPKR